ncbi:MAG TPA: porin [Gammaproteobacteria bacterium]|nr:porin [Gammaproteobacteria bacterium]
MNGLSRAFLITGMLIPALGAAQEGTRPAKSSFNYSYAELGYDTTNFDVGPGDIDGDGFTLSGSFRLTDDWHLFAAYGQDDLDFGIDVDTYAIGVGYTYPIRNDVDLYGRVLYIDQEVDFPGPASADDDGLGLQFRVRGRVNEKLELEGGLQYVDVGNSDTSLQAGARYYFTKAFSAGVGVTFGGDADGIGINARYSF